MMLWLQAFALTQVLEMPVYLFATRGETSWFTRFIVAFGASALTHPIVWFVFPKVWPFRSFFWMIVAAEIFAVVAEALYLRWCRVPRPWVWALVANGFSLSVGLVIRFWGA